MSYLRLLFDAMAAMPQKKCTLWRGIAADLYDDYVEGKVARALLVGVGHPRGKHELCLYR